MIRLLSRLTAVLAAPVALLVLSAAPALAHTEKQEGAYKFTVGWSVEPAYSGQPNRVQLFVHDAKGNPVDGIDSLKVELIFSGQKSDPLAMQGTFDPDSGEGAHGEYDASVIPTRPGNYTFHFTGNVNGQTVDDQFTSSDTTFNPVVDAASAQFPAKDPSPAQLADAATRLQPRVDTAAAAAASASKAAKSAKDSADSAKTLSIVAIVVAVVLGLLAIILARRGRRQTV